MAALATYAVVDFERVSTLGSRNIQRVAGEAPRRCLGFAKIEQSSHTLANHAGQGRVCLGMFVADDPDAVLVLHHAIDGQRHHAAMAAGGTA